MENQETVVRQYGDMVYRLAYAQTRSRNDADDVFQDVFLRYFREPRRFDTEEHRKAWLLRVTVNCAKSLWASPWRQRTEPLSEADAAPIGADDEGLEEALRALPVKYRTVIHLHYFEGYSTEEIGNLLRRRPSTVRTQLTRARRMLAQLLKGDETYEI